ncbi:DNA repair protein RecN [Peptococcus simiae]|uniref:DNA repair protein RecN n=1 Tax=Peptococcus simiae TaxID=1643805 RepID=A0ABW9H123_9FIRM
MLEELTVQNFALLKELQLTFDHGLNVLTGETGAGKSIVVDAMGLLLGERANLRDIRYGCDSALVEGVFSVQPESRTAALAEDQGFTTSPLILSREVRQNGHNTCRINGRQVTLTQYRALAHGLVSIYGQHDYLYWLAPDHQLILLDSLGDQAHQALLADVARAHQGTRQAARNLKKAMKDREADEKARQQARENLEDLRPLKLKVGEEAEVSARHGQLAKRMEIQTVLEEAYAMLYGDDTSAQSLLTLALDRLTEAARLDTGLVETVKDLKSALISVREGAQTVADEISRGGSPAELEALSDRLATYYRLRQQYGLDPDDLINQMKAWEALLDREADDEADFEDLQAAYAAARSHYIQLAKALSESRHQVAGLLKDHLEKELADLAMPHARFEVAFSQGRAGSSGTDQVLFMLQANPGSPALPLHETASGGEMSRLMLAFKTLLTSQEDTETLIFDEIDTGIGGLTLAEVAKKLATVSRQAQVICVTHAPAIAAYADGHHLIEKHTDGTSTHTTVHTLSEGETVEEIARMLGGQADWQLAHASEMRAAAKKRH